MRNGMRSNVLSVAFFAMCSALSLAVLPATGELRNLKFRFSGLQEPAGSGRHSIQSIRTIGMRLSKAALPNDQYSPTEFLQPGDDFTVVEAIVVKLLLPPHATGMGKKKLD